MNRRKNDPTDPGDGGLERLLRSLPPLSPPPRLAAEVRRRVEPLAAARRAAITVRRMWLSGLLLLLLSAAGAGGVLWIQHVGGGWPSATPSGPSVLWWQPWEARLIVLWDLLRQTLADWAAGLAERLTIWRYDVLNLVLAWRRLTSSAAGSWSAPWLQGFLLAFPVWILCIIYMLTRRMFTPTKSD